MFITYMDKESGKTLVACVGADITAEQAALEMGLAKGTWMEITPEEAAELQKPTPEELLAAAQQQFTDAIQARLDAFAKTRGYDGILSAATYATSTVPQFKAEGQYAVEARDLTWAKGYEIMGAVLAGQRPMPSIEEVFAVLPVLEWPEA